MRENIVVIGAGVAGQSLIKNIQQTLPKTKIIGVLDDKVKEGTIIGKDIKVIGNIDALPNNLDQYKVNKIAAEYYHQNLYKPVAKIGQEYLKKRKMKRETLEAYIKKF